MSETAAGSFLEWAQGAFVSSLTRSFFYVEPREAGAALRDFLTERKDGQERAHYICHDINRHLLGGESLQTSAANFQLAGRQLASSGTRVYVYNIGSNNP